MDESATKKWMELALIKAIDSLRTGEVPVGCLFIYKDEVIASGNNTVNATKNATRHAEINCIDSVLELIKTRDLDHREVFRNLDVVVTVEPCIMCASALHQLSVRSILYGCANDRFGGCGSIYNISMLHESDIKIIGGTEAEAATQLLKEFYKGTNPNVLKDTTIRKRNKK